MQMKEETMKTSFQCLQEDQKKMADDNKVKTTCCYCLSDSQGFQEYAKGTRVAPVSRGGYSNLIFTTI